MHSFVSLLVVAATFLAPPSGRAALVPGFQDAAVVSVASPSVLAFSPDGRLFIGEKSSGKVRVYANGALAAQPLLNVNEVVPAGTYFDTFNERGLLGIAFDPSFASNGFVYLYYSLCKTPASPPQPGTNTCQSAKNRVVRVTATGDVADPATQVVLLDDIDSDAGNHNAGWLGFGPVDGKLYVAVGDGGANSAKAQVLGSLNGKILRLNPNGSVPSDNPFVGRAGARGEVFAWGFRNPYRCRFATDGRLFCADVGQVDVEELNVVTAGANYGWPTTEGTFDAGAHPELTNPIYVYRHDGRDAAIIGGDFGAKTAFPGNYQQSFFFADFTRGLIRRALLGPTGVTVQSTDDLITNLGGNSVTDLVAGPDGSLYYTLYSANAVRRLTATSSNRSPVAVASANVVSGAPPLAVQFSSAGSSDADGDVLSYSWSFGDGTATSAVANPTHQYTTAGTYVATLTVSDGMATPGPGTDRVVITVGRPPVVTIAAPIDGASFRAGDTIALAGSATDPEDGVIPAANLHWKVIFHHADHIHPFIDDLPGSPQSFTTNTGGEPDPDVGYELQLRATDSNGLTGTASAFILPVTSQLTLQTAPAGLGVTLDGQPMTAPVAITGVVGLRRTIGTSTVQAAGGQTLYFAGWSDDGSPIHDITTPEHDTTLKASFMPAATCNAPVVLPSDGGTFTTATGGAGVTSNQSGTCAATATGAEQVFQWTPTRSGTATVQTCGGATSFDTVLYLRAGTCATGGELACADDSTACATTEPNDHHASRAAVPVTAGQTYFIVVDGYGGASGTFTLTVTAPSGAAPTATPAPTVTPLRTATAVPTPGPTATVVPTLTSIPGASTTPRPLSTATAAPGACDAVLVPPTGGTFSGTTTGTSALAGTCSVSGNSPERVYQWTPAASGTAVVMTCGGTTAFDTALYVRAGSCGGAQVACNDDSAGCTTAEPNDHHGSRASVAVTAGQTYFVVVDGYNGASGGYTLTIIPPSAASPAEARTATPGPTATPAATPTAVATTTAVPTVTAARTTTAIPTVTAVPTLTAARTATHTPTPVATASTPIDACAEAAVLPAEGGTFAGTTAGASTQAGTCSFTSKAPERVFAWTAPASGMATFSTCGDATAYDTILYLRADTCGGAELGCNDDTTGCGTGEPSTYHGSRIARAVTAGQLYFIVVDGYDTAAGPFTLTVVPPLAATGTPIASRTATPALAPTPTAVPPTATSTPLRTGTAVAATPTRTAAPVPTAAPTGVPTDPCAATVVPAEGGTFSGTTTGGNGLTGSCGASDEAPEAVFRWTPDASGPATIATCGTATLYDTVLYMRSGSCAGPELGCNDDTTGCGAGQAAGDYHASRLTPTVTAGQTYWIVVDGYDGARGPFGLTITPPAPSTPPDGTCAAPFVIPADGGVSTGTTNGSGTLSSCSQSQLSGEKVYRWTPTTSGTATLETCGDETEYDTVLAVSETTCGGSPLVCGDDAVGCGTATGSRNGSRVTLDVVAGRTYFVVVDGYNGRTGAYRLNVIPPA